MGRVSKYKKIKHFDLCSKKNSGNLDKVGIWGFGDDGSAKPKKRSKKSIELRRQKVMRRLARQKRFNNKSSSTTTTTDLDADNNGRSGYLLPPSDDEDEFDLKDMEGSLKQHKSAALEILGDTTSGGLPTVNKSSANSTSSSLLTSTTTTTHGGGGGMIDKHEIKEATKLLKADAAARTRGVSQDDKNKAPAAKHEPRRDHESKNAFNRRVKAETRQIIKQQKLKDLNPEKRRRKKKFLNQKKKQKKHKGQQQSENDDVDDDDDEQRYHHQVDQVAFGEQAKRPPIFKTLPRGSKKPTSASTKSGNGHKTIKTNKDIEDEQQNLEKMRLRVREQYAIIKAKRKRAGDFHL